MILAFACMSVVASFEGLDNVIGTLKTRLHAGQMGSTGARPNVLCKTKDTLHIIEPVRLSRRTRLRLLILVLGGIRANT